MSANQNFIHIFMKLFCKYKLIFFVMCKIIGKRILIYIIFYGFTLYRKTSISKIKLKCFFMDRNIETFWHYTFC